MDCNTRELKLLVEAVNRKRAELDFNNRQADLFWIGYNSVASSLVEPAETKIEPEAIKLWPLVGLAAIQKNKSASWRIWVLAHHLDQQGSGKITRSELWNYLDKLNVGDRKRRRWLSQALKTGLMRQVGDDFYLASLGRAAYILKARHVGKPATIENIEALVKPGWKAFVWSAYLATQEGKLISQEKKTELTGITTRTQREWQAQVPGEARQNYTKRGRLTPEQHLQLRYYGRHTITNDRGLITQRLPDIRIVPLDISRMAKKGRSRKAQKQTNFLYNVVQEPHNIARLFNENANGVKASLRMIRKQEPKPFEVFELAAVGEQANQWRAITVY